MLPFVSYHSLRLTREAASERKGRTKLPSFLCECNFCRGSSPKYGLKKARRICMPMFKVRQMLWCSSAGVQSHYNSPSHMTRRKTSESRCLWLIKLFCFSFASVHSTKTNRPEPPSRTNHKPTTDNTHQERENLRLVAFYHILVSLS